MQAEEAGSREQASQIYDQSGETLSGIERDNKIGQPHKKDFPDIFRHIAQMAFENYREISGKNE